MEHRLVSIDKVEVRHDGKFAALTLSTATAPAFTLEIDVARIDELIVQLLEVARHAAQLQGATPTLSVGSPTSTAPIRVERAAAALGRQGHVQLLFPVGVIVLSLEIPNSSTTQLGRELVELGTRMESEPKSAQ